MRCRNERPKITNLDAKAAQGTLSLNGWIALSTDAGAPLHPIAPLQSVPLADSDAVAGTATGTRTSSSAKTSLPSQRTRFGRTPDEACSCSEMGQGTSNRCPANPQDCSFMESNAERRSVISTKTDGQTLL